MKRAINILCLLAVLAIVFLIALDLFVPVRDRRGTFISDCIVVVLVFLCIPLLFHQFSLLHHKNDLTPKHWLAIYGVMALIFLLIAGRLGFFAAARDFPAAISKDYERASGVSCITQAKPTEQTIELDGLIFVIEREAFETTINGEAYEIVYLKHSRHIIDLLDGEGTSLLKPKN